MRHEFVKADAHSDPVAVALGGGAKELCVTIIAAAEENELQIARHQAIEDALDQVESLLRGEAGNHRHDRRTRWIGQIEHLAHVPLAVTLTLRLFSPRWGCK